MARPENYDRRFGTPVFKPLLKKPSKIPFYVKHWQITGVALLVGTTMLLNAKTIYHAYLANQDPTIVERAKNRTLDDVLREVRQAKKND